MGLMPSWASCHCAILVQKFFSWVLRGPNIYSCAFFEGLNYFSWVFHGSKVFSSRYLVGNLWIYNATPLPHLVWNKLHLITQWSLLIMDILYSRHLSIAETFFRNGWNCHNKTYVQRTLYSGHHFYVPIHSPQELTSL